jgi:hypothetical protein
LIGTVSNRGFSPPTPMVGGEAVDRVRIFLSIAR